MAQTPFDPLGYDNLARSVVMALLRREPDSLPPQERFVGSGVYALYYTGPFAAYRPLTTPHLKRPIYVGCALRQGARKGRVGERRLARDYSLYRRLVEHGRSIAAVENLEVRHFECQYLVVLPVWVRLAERSLVEHFRPVWNLYVDGFGNHPVGKRRLTGARPQWDIVHPGRSWAAQMPAKQPAEEILDAVRTALRGEA